MKKSRKPPEDDDALWYAVTRSVTPLPGRSAPMPKPAPPPAADPPAQKSTPADIRRNAIRAPLPVTPASLPPLKAGVTPGVDRRTSERLRKGRMEIEGRIDLHGMTQPAAHTALKGFILRSHHLGRRTVLVITGKGRIGQGGGVLRAEVPNWLNQEPLREKVLAFFPAQPKDGGGGALYVLLKRQRPLR